MHRITLPLVALIAAAGAPAQVLDVPLERFGAAPGWCAYERAEAYDFARQDGVSSFTASGGKGTMIWTRDFDPPLDLQGRRYVTFRYRLQGTDPKLYSYTVYFADQAGGGMLARNLIFGAENLMHDGQWHTARTTLQDFDTLQTVALRIRAQEGQQGRLDVAWLRLSDKPLPSSLTETLRWQAGHQGQGQPLALPLQTDLARLQSDLSLEDWFAEAGITAYGVNFTVPLSGAAAISTPGEARGETTVPLTGSGAALGLLIAAKFPPQMLGYSGWEPGDMTDRPEQFVVRLAYADGTVDEHVPFCLGQKRHGMWRGLNAYAVPLRPGQALKELRLYDGMRTSTFHLVAASICPQALTPAVAGPPLRTPPDRRSTWNGAVGTFRLANGKLTLPGIYSRLVFDLSQGIKLSEVVHEAKAGWPLRAEPAPFFAVSEGNKRWTSDQFKLVDGQCKTMEAELLFRSDEAQAEVRLRFDGLLPVRISAAVRNLADQPRTLEVTCPQVQLTTSRPEDLWVFIPFMSAVWSNRDAAYETAYSGHLPLQFQDCYDRRTGGGVCLGTRSLDLRQRYFKLSKSGGRLIQRLEYRDNPPYPPGEWVELPETVLDVHGGDWREPWRGYLAWKREWYKPAQARLDWYRDVWNFRTWWTHTMGVTKDRWKDCNLFDADRQEYQTDKFVARDREQFGDVDMVHFFDWRISKQYGLWGDYSHYEDVGGLDKFRGMVKDLQGRGIRVGLYLDTYLCSRKSLIGQAHGEEWAIQDQTGRFRTAYSQPDDPMLNMCVNHPGWQDYLAQTCARVARETGCDGIYLDEGMSDYPGYWCWRKNHGHPVPGVNQVGLLDLCKQVRAALPANVAFYTEWVPPDCLIPYLDGAYQAGLRFSDPLLSPGFVQTTRFAFPDFRVLTISNGGSMYDGIWEGVKYSLFSGVPLYSLSWGHDDECLPIFRRYSQILHEYSAEFNTMAPQSFVDTEQAEVFANEFPGAKRTVWTLFNGRYDTFTGPVLKVKHVAGATYRDVWNARALQPKIVQGQAVLETTLGPRGIGVVVQTRK
ncbi:DUF6259 domain-containing protein [bacterium]|nr:DUF6259 domain-containing protein [bacterium]